MIYRASKTYGHDLGLSCAFRQWRAVGHCSSLHGYALSFRFVFEARELDDCGWVLDFGSLGPLKGALFGQFDHRTLVAQDDPYLPELQAMHHRGVMDVRVVRATGCEAFARLAHDMAERHLSDRSQLWRVRCVEVECREHGANGATFSVPANWGPQS